LSGLYLDALRRTPADRTEPLIPGLETTPDPENASVPDGIELEIPVLQVIGERDEVWGSAMPEELARRFPNLKRTTVPGARRHKDVFFRARAFYEALTSLLRSSGVTPAAPPARRQDLEASEREDQLTCMFVA
jgi:hypothetical protein